MTKFVIIIKSRKHFIQFRYSVAIIKDQIGNHITIKKFRTADSETIIFKIDHEIVKLECYFDFIFKHQPKNVYIDPIIIFSSNFHFFKENANLCPSLSIPK